MATKSFKDLLADLPDSQLKRLTKLIAAERLRREPDSEPKISEMDDASFRKLVAELFTNKRKDDNND